MGIRLKHSRPIRWSHWLNVPILGLMFWSGHLIYWANDVYLSAPATVYETLGIDHRLAEGIAWHFFVQWLFIINGIFYVVTVAVTGHWRELLPGKGAAREAWLVLLHDLRLRREAPPESGKFNGAQKIAYSGIIVCGAGSVLTGYAIHKPVQLGWLTSLLGGYDSAHQIHYWLAMSYAVFFVIHVTQVAKAGWNNFRSMITGYEFRKDA